MPLSEDHRRFVNNLIKDLDAERAAHAATREQLVQARKDTERMDWLDTLDTEQMPAKFGPNIRESIDAARDALRAKPEVVK